MIQDTTTGSICAFFACQVNWIVSSTAQPAYRPTRRVHSRVPRSVTHHKVPSAASSDGSRKAMRRLPVSDRNAACNHMNNGGLSEYSSLPRCGNSQSPLSTICLATRAKRGSSAGHGSRRPSPAPRISRANSQNSQVSRRVSVIARIIAMRSYAFLSRA